MRVSLLCIRLALKKRGNTLVTQYHDREGIVDAFMWKRKRLSLIDD